LEAEIAYLRREIESIFLYEDKTEPLGESSITDSVVESEFVAEVVDDQEPVLVTDLESQLGTSPNEDSTARQMRDIKLFFAKCWHPDRNVTKASYMSELNRLSASTNDPVELLAQIPWEEEAWLAHIEGESLGAQWERISDWLSALEIAQKRLSEEIAIFTDSWNYGECQRWIASGRVKDYFAIQAEAKRREILELETIRDALQEELLSNLPTHPRESQLVDEKHE
jgi:hypothetical protein